MNRKDRMWAMLCCLLGIFVVGGSSVMAGWEAQDSGGAYNILSVFFSDRNKGVAVGESNSKVVMSEDGGITWKPSKVEGIDLQPYGLQSVWFSNPNVGWIGGHIHPGGAGKTVLLKTEDSGKTWVSKPLPDNVESISKVYFDKDGKKGWLITHFGEFIWKTEDGGETWAGVNVGEIHPKVKANPIHPGLYVFSPDHILLAGGGIIMDIANKTAVETGLPEGNSLVAIHFFDKNVGWAVGLNGVIMHTKDGGKSWNVQQSGVKNPLRGVWALSQDEAWVTGEAIYAGSSFANKNGVLLHTTDGGNTWKDENPTTSTLMGLFFLDKNHGWAVGGRGGSASEPPGMVLIYRED